MSERILFLGEIGHGQTSAMRMRALERLGHTVSGVNTVSPWQRAAWLQRQLQKRLQSGPIIDSINSTVVLAARDFAPTLIWAEKQEYLRADTVDVLRETGARLVHFTPDPYFSLPWKRTRLMDAAIRQFDVLVYCKSYEVEDYRAQGKPIVYMPLGFDDETHRPMGRDDPAWRCGVGFVGGWEPRRERMLAGLVRRGADLKLFGGYWEFLRDGAWSPRRHVILRQLAGGEPFSFHRDPELMGAYQGGEIYGDDYARALSGAGIGLGFLRQVCADQHTTRTFEIPACGSLLLADRTDEHREFFEEGKEAEFFSSDDELYDKSDFYSREESARSRIARAGLDRCHSSGYSYLHRMRAALVAVAAVGAT